MKRTIFTALVFFSLSVNSFADNPTADTKLAKVTTTVQSKFAESFAGAENVSWEVTDKYQKAYFTLNGIRKTAFYNYQDAFVATTHHVDWSMLPHSSLYQIGKAYRGYMIKSVIQYTNEEKVYFVNLLKNKKEILVQVSPDKTVSLFKRIN